MRSTFTVLECGIVTSSLSKGANYFAFFLIAYAE